MREPGFSQFCLCTCRITEETVERSIRSSAYQLLLAANIFKSISIVIQLNYLTLYRSFAFPTLTFREVSNTTFCFIE